MQQVCSIFSQILRLIPRDSFQAAIALGSCLKRYFTSFSDSVSNAWARPKLAQS